MLHIHFSGDELLTVITGQLTSTLIAPNNTVYTHDLMAGDNVVYPRGWLHLQYNPTCTQTYALVAFNARSVGTVNIPSNMANAGNEYLRAAYGRRFPDPVGLWVTNAACAKACAAAGRRLA
ncbi:hypothetical protein HYH03_009810 [Edaphochlamys debaryana]|uniref:Germin-like protein n=1 Tax=Edaphochlamys debaryana TaxID=47281 RepID=A0A835Y6D5_9CHLO|nr:hypothetical protein HYH03_009810 [Edaphochlamys debaryana]|eukprot:KAG2491854.1 hypothetical protein HYH03_009810 [Edaphochlamys debaryana]